MKKILIIVALALFAVSCSNDDDAIMTDQDVLMTNYEEFIGTMDPYNGYGLNVYAQLDPNLPGKLNGIPQKYDDMYLSENYLLNGTQRMGENGEQVNGTMKLYQYSYDDAYAMVSSKIAGQIKVSSGDLIFYHGEISLYLESKHVVGKLVFPHGTGKFAGCSGEVEISGSLDHGYLKIDCNGRMNLTQL